jgi:hypothetical protein
MTWKSVSLVFRRGTQEARALKGRRIRAVGPLFGIATIGLDGRQRAPVDIIGGTKGFVGYVLENALDAIRLCFSKKGLRLQTWTP